MRFHNYILLALGILLTSNASGVDINPTATRAEDFVPEGWKLFSVAYGDLNLDGKDDVALVIQGTDKEKIIRNDDGYGKKELDTNRRVLLIAFKKDDTYELVLKQEKVLPSQDDANDPCLDERLDDDGIKITARNTLKINLHYWSSCGTWSTSNDFYTFRHQNDHFELIGFDGFSLQRDTLDSTSISINYSTGKILTVTGTGDPNLEPVRKWSRLKTKRTYDLQTVDLDTLEGISWKDTR
jgi:hypothetical protein